MDSIKLQLVFETANGRTYSLYIDNPISSLDEAQEDIMNFADAITTNGVISTKNGKLALLKEVNIISRTVTPVKME